jgi:hypothetical protein
MAAGAAPQIARLPKGGALVALMFVLPLFQNYFGSKPPWTPEDLYEEHRYLALQPKYVDASASEAEFVFTESAAEARAAGNLGDKPSMVLTEGQNEMLNNIPRGASGKDIENFFMAMNELQVQEAHLSTRGRQIIVPDSGHLIPFERPDTVVNAVREVVTDCNSRSTASGR